MQRNLTAAQLCLRVRRHVASSLFKCDHHFSALLRPSQLFSFFATPFKSSQSCSISPLISSTLFTSSLLFSTLPNDSHLRSTHLTSFSAYLNSSHLLNSGQIFSTLLNPCHGDAYTQSMFLHGEALTHSKLLDREAFTRSKLSHREACTHRSFYTEKFLRRKVFPQSKLLHTAISYIKIQIKFFHEEKLWHSHRQDFTQSKLFHRASICTEKLLHREDFTVSFYFTQRSF